MPQIRQPAAGVGVGGVEEDGGGLIHREILTEPHKNKRPRRALLVKDPNPYFHHQGHLLPENKAPYQLKPRRGYEILPRLLPKILE